MNGGLQKFPQPSVDAVLGRARHLLQQGHHAGALAALAEVEQAYPLSGLLWQERAKCHGAQGDLAAALAAYKRAVELNDALPESWQALRELHESADQATEARNAAQALERLQELPPQIAAGSSLLNEGEP